MTKTQINKLTAIVVQLYKELGSIKDVTEVYAVTKQDCLWLIFGTEASKMDYFRNKNFDRLPLFDACI